MLGKQKSQVHIFLIAEDGKIYQTAKLDQVCWHMGFVMSKCRLENTCTQKDSAVIKSILHSKSSWTDKFRKVYKHEKQKNYPDRYPMNSDSLGIELVGAYLGSGSDTGPFEKLTKSQANSFLWLVTELLQHYNLSFSDDVYAHGSVARKKVNEGVGALDWLKDNYK